MAFSLTISGNVWTTLLKALAINFIKHRKALAHNGELKNLLFFTYKTNNLGSDILFKALEDPNIEVPGVDAKIPLMDKNKNTSEIEYHQTKQIDSKLNH